MNVRILERGEWGELPLTLAPLFKAIDTRGAAVVVVEDGEETVACCALLNLPHLEGAWIAPSRRKNPAVGKALLMGIVRLILERTTGWVLASSDEESVVKLFEHLGAEELPVSTGTRAYALDLTSDKHGAEWLRGRLIGEDTWATG